MRLNHTISIISENMLQMPEGRRRELNDFIICNMGTPFHEVYFNCIASECFHTSAFYLIVYQKEKIVGVCPIHYITNGFIKMGYSNLDNFEIPYGGWIYDRAEISLRELVKCFKIGWMEMLQYRSNIIIDETSDDYQGYFPFDTVILDLKRDIEDIYCGLNTKTRNKIRRASKIGVKIRYLSIKELDAFMTLTRELKKRIGHPCREEFYYKVFEKYQNEQRIQCIVTEYRNEIISGGIIIANKNFAIGWIPGRKNHIPNNLYQNELLFWEHIVWGKNNNVRYLDFNGLDQNKLPHLARLKLSFSKDIKHFYGKSYKNVFFKVFNKLCKYTNNIYRCN
jgi:hypothetical protein